MYVYVCVCVLRDLFESLDDNWLCEVDPGAWTSTDDTGEHEM